MGTGTRKPGAGRRRILALCASLFGVVALGWGALHFWLPGYLEQRMLSALRQAGFEDPKLHVRSLGLRTLELADVSLGPGASARRIELELRPWILGRLDRVNIRGADVDRGVLDAVNVDHGEGRSPVSDWPTIEIEASRVGMDDGTTVSLVRGRLRPPARAGQPWSVRLVGSVDQIDADRFGAPVGLRQAKVELTGQVTARRIHELAAQVRGQAVLPDGSAESVSLWATSEGDGLSARLAAGDGDTPLTVDVELPDPLAEGFPDRVEWRARGALPDFARRRLAKAGVRTGQVSLHGSGSVARDGRAWRVRTKQLSLSGSRLAYGDLSARSWSLAGTLGARFGPGGARVDTGNGAVTVNLRGMPLEGLAPWISRGRIRGEGTLDGWARIQLSPGTSQPVQLRSAQLRSRGPGRLGLRDAGKVAELSGARVERVGQLVKKRIAGALADFDFSQLDVAVRPEGRGLELVTNLRGTGHWVKQELSLTVRAHGIDRVTDRALSLARISSLGASGATPMKESR